MSVRVAEV
jgi:hypothetical protein